MHLFKQNNIWMAVLTDCHLYILTYKRNCLCSFHALQFYLWRIYQHSGEYEYVEGL